MLSQTTFTIINLVYIVLNMVMLKSIVEGGRFRKLYIIDYLLAIFFHGIYITLMYEYRPVDMRNSSMRTEYLEYGSTTIDGVYGRKYRYDLLVDKKEKN